MNEEVNLEQQRLKELAIRVENSMSTQSAKERILKMFDMLLDGIQREVGLAARESLLMYRGFISDNRDVEWARTMAAIWLKEPGTQIPRNPLELQAVILGWQGARERDLAKKSTREGYEAGWREALLKGAAFGWGASAAGKSREETLKAAESMKP